MNGSVRDNSGLSRRGFLRQAGTAALVAGGVGALAAAAPTASRPADKRLFRPLDPAKKIRVGVIGGGFGASFNWHQDPNCVVTAVADLRPTRREVLKQAYHCDTAYETLDELLRDKSVDAVAIFTGAPDHVPHSVAAMRAGKHVICAVPACIDLAQAELLRETKEKTGLRYMMAETSYYDHHAIAARDLFAEGAFGELFYSEVEYCHPITEEDRERMWWVDGQPTWRLGFAPMLYATHSTAFITGVTRERLVDVSCQGVLAPKIEGYGKGKNKYDNPFNTQVALFKTDAGHICRGNVIWTGTNTGVRAQWFGTEMSYFSPSELSGQPLKLAGVKAPEWKELPDYNGRLPEPLRIESGHGGSHTFLTHEFVRALVEDREPAIDVYESLAMTVPGIIAHQSSMRDGERLKIPSFDRA